MGQVIGFVSLKGGVGKTTLSASVATSLANVYGKKVLLVDANYSAPNLGLHMDIIAPKKTIHDVLSGDSFAEAVHERYGVDVVPGSFLYNKEISPLKLKDKIAAVRNNYDFIVLDSSPALNDEMLSVMLSSDQLFVVTTPDYPTLSCSMKAARLAKQRNRPIAGIVINRVANPNFEISLEQIQESSGIPVVARVPENRQIAKSIFMRVPATLHDGRSKFSKEVRRLSSVMAGEREMRPLFARILRKNPKAEEVNRELMRENFYTSVFR